MKYQEQFRIRRSGVARSLGLVAWLALCFSAALTGVLFPPDAWYGALEKPAWNPPSWIFGPVWTLLYFVMGVAAWLVWSRRGWRAPGLPLVWFLAQLALNALWTPLFFGMQNPAAALVCIILLVMAIAGTMRAFQRAGEPVAAVLLAPYLAWTSFATVLNFTLWRMNA